jgi:hypothetical protein
VSTDQLDAALIERIDRHFQERREQVPLLRTRSDDEGITAIRTAQDVVPCLFPHSVFKSYPPVLVEQGRWEQMNRWLDSVSSRRIDVDVTGVTDLDGWLARLRSNGHYVMSSSGTQGKASFMDKSMEDITVGIDAQIGALVDRGVKPDNSWIMVGLGGSSGNFLATLSGTALRDRFARPDGLPNPPQPPQTEGHLAFMSRLAGLRRKMAEGTATAGELAQMEEDSARREKETVDRLNFLADAMLARADEKYLIGTMMSSAWRFYEVLRERGIEPGRFTADNVVFQSGGTKGVVVPENGRALVLEMLNVEPQRYVQLYSMQEVNLQASACDEGRYHPQDGLVVLVLDEAGEQLAPVVDGIADGRAALIDLTAHARWGGIISGDHIQVDVTGCPCGRSGPSILPDISRFSNVGDDKLTCAGTMDAYVRGFIDS